MKKIVIIYLLMMISIAILSLLINMPWRIFSSINFPQQLHVIIEGTNSLLMFLIFLVSNHLYSRTKEERLAIFGGGFLTGSILNCIHIITVKNFPYDFLSLANIQNNPTIVYLFLGNLVLPLAIYYTLIHKPSLHKIENFRLKTYIIYFLIFLVLILVPFLINNAIPKLTYDFNLIVHSLEFINYSLYIMLAFIIVNIRHGAKHKFFPTFTVGLIISGFGGLFYINPISIQLNEILAHIFQAIGLLFFLAGINSLLTYSSDLRFKDELVAHLCLMLIAFYIVFASIASVVFDVIFPPISAYIFVEFILIFQFIVYLIANKVTQPITNIIDTLSEYTPGQGYIDMPIVRNDEIGVLTEKINSLSMLSWQKILEISKIAEKERSIRRIFETMRRVSNINIIKNSIMDEIKKAFNPDRCFIALYDSLNDSFYYDKYFEQLPSKILWTFKNEDDNDFMVKQLNDFLKNNTEIYFDNIEDYIVNNSLKGTPKEELLRGYQIKSCYHIPILYASHLLGCLVLHYTSKYNYSDKTDLAYLKTMATQIGIAIYQAKA